jgi:predicted AAA+ superfamily ATPase
LLDFDLDQLDEFLINQLKDYFFEYLKFGSYPAVITANTEKEKKIKLASIVEDYFYKDVRNLLNKVDFLNFNKVLKVLAEKV